MARRMMPATVERPTRSVRIRAALWFAEQGFGVFSVWSANADGSCRCPKGAACDNAGKHPTTAHGFQDATRDSNRIRTFLSAGSEPNYGLVCPEGVFALDVDGEGVEHLAAIEARLGPLPPTLRTRTAHGEHVFLRWPAALPRPIGQLWGFVTRWGSGQNAGYVIGPRSVHASGAVYEPEGSAFEIAELPETWAHDVLAPAPESDPLIEITSGGYELPDYGYTGSRYTEILRYIGSRYMRGISRDEIWSGVVSVLSPRFEHPLSEADLRTRFERAWKGTPEHFGQPMSFDVDLSDLPPAVMVAPADWPAAPDLAAYHGVLGDIVNAVAPVTEADPVAILGTLLASAGACMGHWQTIYQGSTQAANLFVVLVGDSATGRKGTAASIGRDVMSAAYPGWEKLIVAGLGSGEGLIAHLKRSGDEQSEHRALVLESEFGRLLTVMAREGSTLSPVVRDAWDGAAIGRFIAREQSLVTWHHVSVAAHVTSVELRQKMTSVDAANGFGNRFLWLAVRRTKLVPFPESPKELVRPYVDALFRAIEAAQTPADIHWSPDAADQWEVMYAASASRVRLGLLGALLARAEAQVARLALLYALLDRSSTVDLRHLLAARAVWDYAERSAAYIFGTSTGNRHADALREMLGQGPIEWESAKRALGLRTAADLREAVAVLTSTGMAEVVSVPRRGGGRPVSVIREPGRTTQTTQTTQGPAQGDVA
jgi:hypothetical protein